MSILRRSMRGMGPALTVLTQAGIGTRVCMPMTGCRAVGRSGARLALVSTRRTTCMVGALCMGAASMGVGTDTEEATASAVCVERATPLTRWAVVDLLVAEADFMAAAVE